MTSVRRFAIALLLLAGPAGCGSGTPVECPAGATRVGAGCEPVRLPELAEGWTAIVPGGGTACAHGGEYRFFVRPGVENRLLVSFQGGGACWSAGTCAPGSAMNFFRSELDDGDRPDQAGGIFDFAHPENPFAGWFVVHIPYCTGDLHWGGGDRDYLPTGGGQPFTVRHRGFINASAALDWIADRFNGPADLVVAGESAGAYGAVVHAPRLFERFPHARAAHISDGGCGVVPDDFFGRVVPLWAAEGGFAGPVADRLGGGPAGWTYDGLFSATAGAYPGHRFAVVTSAYDGTQEAYAVLLGLPFGEWPGLMRTQLDGWTAAHDNVRLFIAGGSDHTALYDGRLYAWRVGPVRLAEWLAALVNGGDPGNAACVACEQAEEGGPGGY